MRSFLLLATAVLVLSGCGDEKQKSSDANVQPQIKITPNALAFDNDTLPVSYDMDGNKKVDISLDGEDTELSRQIGAIASVRSNYDKVSNELLGKRLSRNYFLKCSSCHDDYANGVVGPSLLAKSSNDIFDIIKSYKNSDKKNVLMQYLVSQMDDKEIRSLADEIAEFNKEIRKEQK